MSKIGLFFLSFFVLSSCNSRNSIRQGGAQPEIKQEAVSEIQPEKPEERKVLPVLGLTAGKLDSMGLVNIVSLDPEIGVHMVYSTPDNFVEEAMYEDLTEAYLLPEAAEKLVKAHRLLKEKHPEYRFMVYDAARPMSVQRKMWEVAVRTGKQYYVANPAKGGGLHNYGAAVDLTILDGNGNPLPMGTEYDHLGKEANTDREKELVAAGKLTPAELENRLLLREVMRAAGFRTVTSEWWHFNHCSRTEAIERYQLID